MTGGGSRHPPPPPGGGRAGAAAGEPQYESFAGWSQTTAGLTEWDQLPVNARRYLERVQSLIGTPIDIVSTGPDREHTIVLRHPYRG